MEKKIAFPSHPVREKWRETRTKHPKASALPRDDNSCSPNAGDRRRRPTRQTPDTRGCGPGCPQVGCAGASRSDHRGPRTPSQGPRARGAGRCVCLSAAPASRVCGRQGSAPRPSPQLGAAPGVRTASGSFVTPVVSGASLWTFVLAVAGGGYKTPGPVSRCHLGENLSALPALRVDYYE